MAWATLKAEAAALERYIEQRLHVVNPRSTPGSGASADLELGAGERLDPDAVRLHEIDDSLRKFEDVVGRCSAAATASGSAANAAMAQRFRDVLTDLRSEQRRQVAAQRARAEAAALLGGTRGAGESSDGGSGDGVDMLLRERGSLLSSTRAVDDILAQAAAASDVLRAQGASLSSAAGRLGGFVVRLPGASVLMGAISARRTRNDTIVALVVAVCVCFAVWSAYLRNA